MPLQALLLFATLGMDPSPVAQTSDTLDAIRTVKEELIERYRTSVVQGRDFRGRRTPAEVRDWLGSRCSPDDGNADCFGGDWVRERCPADLMCHPPSDRLEDLLLVGAREHPESEFLTGQAVFNLLRFGRPLEAMEIAQACQASEGWCRALEGHVLQSVGRVQEAGALFRAFVESAPDSVKCRNADATWLLGSWSYLDERRTMSPPEMWRRWSERQCAERMAASDTIWWLADPLFIVEGNDRWAEHINRALKAKWVLEIRGIGSSQDSQDWIDTRWAAWLRRGPWDSYHTQAPVRNGTPTRWTSKEAARYHFIPDFEGEGFENPTWRLLSEVDSDEGYTPPYGPFHLLPVQIARFRSRPPPSDDPEPGPSSTNSLRIAAAGTVQETPIADVAQSAYLTLSDGPESFPLQLEAAFHEGRAVFLADAPSQRYVASLEVITEAGIGWHREMIQPLATEGAGLSDILLYEPQGRNEPDSLMAAASTMLPTTEIHALSQLGLYWEVYGAEADVGVEFQLRLEKEGGGFVERLRRLLPGGEEEAPGTLSWEEPATGPVSPKAIVLDVEGLEPGRYTLVVRARWEGQEVVERTRVMVVR